MNRNSKTRRDPVQEVKKPFLNGDAVDENTVKNSLAFFGVMILVFIVSLIACASTAAAGSILRLLINGPVSQHLRIHSFSVDKLKDQKSERKICFHHLKGYITGIIGTLPFLIAAVYLAVLTKPQMTGAGTLPSWMQSYAQRSDIGSALINYTQPEGMTLLDYVRTLIRICIIPFVNIIGSSNQQGMAVVERLSPLILLLPAAAYGTGYIQGKRIRSKIHTAIKENNKKRIRIEKKKRAARIRSREPEQLN